MGKHDKITMKLTEKILKKMLVNKFMGEQGAWSQSEDKFIVEKHIGSWTFEDTEAFLKKHEDFLGCDLPFTILKQRQEKAHQEITNMTFEESVFLDKTFEFPLIKGEGQYKVTKGFIDLIVHIQARQSGLFWTYQSKNIYEFVVEIKKEEDFNDMGAILRQINEYKSYYRNGCGEWISSITTLTSREITTLFCIIADKIPDEHKKFLESEGIDCFSLIDLSNL